MSTNPQRTSFLPAALAILALLAAFGPAPRADAAPPEIQSAKQLLERLEQADRDVEAITARVQYDRRFRLQGDRHRRRGDLYFRVQRRGEQPPRRSFVIDFETLIVGRRMEQEAEMWVFDGEWLVEKKPAEKQFIKRRIAPPDADFDPLAIGEGPMPIPIGQKADAILERYEAEIRPATDIFKDENAAGIRSFVEGTVQLLLTPRERIAEREDLKEIRLWYRWHDEADRFLPRLARTVNRSGDTSYVQLIQMQVKKVGEEGGPEIPEGIFDVSPPPAEEGWEVEVIDELPSERSGRADAGRKE